MFLPKEIDEIALSDAQGVVLADITNKLVMEAKYSLADAIPKAVGIFRLMFDKQEHCWKAKKKIRLKEHGATVSNKFFRFDLKAGETMGRRRAKPKNETLSNKLLDGDEESIAKVVDLVDQEMLQKVEKKTGKKLKKRKNKGY